MANILNITAADSGKKFPLRGDMAPHLDFTPADNHFRVSFVTQDAGNFTISSTLHPFRALNSATQSALSIGGKIGLFVEVMYDTAKNEFVVTETNLVSGDAGTGTGTGGTAATIAVDSTVTGAAGSTALVENVGTASAVRLKFTIPRGDTGAAGTGGSGTSFGIPAGGTAGQVLAKTGSADYAVSWTTPVAGSGGGTVNTDEIVLTPDVNGNVELNAAAGNSFRLVTSQAVKILNPVGYTGAAKISLVLVAGGGNITWDTNWAFADSQPPTFASITGGLNEVEARLTHDGVADTWLVKVTPDRTALGGYGKITAMARIGSTPYYMLANAAGTGAFNQVVSGNTVYILRSGKAAEATGTIYNDQGGTFIVAGAPIGGTGDQRPLLQMMKTDFSEGPPRGANRPSFGKQVLGAEGGPVGVGKSGSTYVFRDLRITGGRNDDADCRGIGQNGQAALLVQNVDITDCHNGILTDNLTQTPLTIINSLLDMNGVGGPILSNGGSTKGFTHNIYAGHNNAVVTIKNSTISNAIDGDNVKVRSGTLVMEACLVIGAVAGRELEIPNGGAVDIKDCIFHKPRNATNASMMIIGNGGADNTGEGIDTTRPRSYTFTNCRFICDYADPNDGRDVYFMSNRDTVKITYIDCEWVGPGALANNSTGTETLFAGMTTNAGERYLISVGPPIKTFTGGPLGPRVAVGKPSSVAMTPVV